MAVCRKKGELLGDGFLVECHIAPRRLSLGQSISRGRDDLSKPCFLQQHSLLVAAGETHEMFQRPMFKMPSPLSLPGKLHPGFPLRAKKE